MGCALKREEGYEWGVCVQEGGRGRECIEGGNVLRERYGGRGMR